MRPGRRKQPTASADPAQAARQVREGTAFQPPRAKRQKFAGGLTDEQKATLCIWAGQAADRLQIAADTATRTAWRREQQALAVGISSLCSCTQTHYGALKAHFQALAGKLDRALDTHLHHQANAKRQAYYLVLDACRRGGLHPGYANAICKRQYRCELSEASEPQLKRILYTVRNRANAKTNKAVKAQPASADPF